MNDARTWEIYERLRTFRNSADELTSEGMSVVQNRSSVMCNTGVLERKGSWQ